MQVTGFPANPLSGNTYCVKVSGANGPISAEGRGSIQVVSVTQSLTRPNEWIVCFSLDMGRGSMVVKDGPVTRFNSLRGR